LKACFHKLEGKKELDNAMALSRVFQCFAGPPLPGSR